MTGAAPQRRWSGTVIALGVLGAVMLVAGVAMLVTPVDIGCGSALSHHVTNGIGPDACDFGSRTTLGWPLVSVGLPMFAGAVGRALYLRRAPSLWLGADRGTDRGRLADR